MFSHSGVNEPDSKTTRRPTFLRARQVATPTAKLLYMIADSFLIVVGNRLAMATIAPQLLATRI